MLIPSSLPDQAVCCAAVGKTQPCQGSWQVRLEGGARSLSLTLVIPYKTGHPHHLRRPLCLLLPYLLKLTTPKSIQLFLLSNIQQIATYHNYNNNNNNHDPPKRCTAPQSRRCSQSRSSSGLLRSKMVCMRYTFPSFYLLSTHGIDHMQYEDHESESKLTSSSNPRYQNCRSAFNRWGRWVLAGILILMAIFLMFIFL